MKKSRLEYSLINSSISMFIYILRIVIQFVGRSFFIYFLGAKYLGLNGLFTNILSFLSLAELGIGSSIIYSLYKPLAQKDESKVKALMNLYKKTYEFIGIFIGIVGVLIIPLLPLFIKNSTDIPHMYRYYVLFLLNSVLSYFFTYKRSLAIADQKNYLVAINDFAFLFFMNIVQVIALYFRHRIRIGFLVQILFTLFSNINISRTVDKRYSYLKEKDVVSLDKQTKDEVKKNVKGILPLHSKIGGVIVMGTDNILISTFVNLTAVGIYSNYSLIVTSVQNLCKQITNSITASVGNFAVSNKKKDSFELFKKHFFINHSLIFFSSILLLTLMNPFISLWVGAKYMLPMSTTILIVLNYSVQVYRNTSFVFIESFGLYWSQRKKPIIEAGVNLLLSLLLLIVFDMGINGVLIGTIGSSLGFVIWYEAFIIYKTVFEKRFIHFFLTFWRSFIELIISAIVVFLLNEYLANGGSTFLQFITKTLITIVTELIAKIILAIFSNKFYLEKRRNFRYILKK
ncbi:sugar translocase [Enterococcus faecium]|nr:sugar translocase [Enterococcus faecium]